MRVRWIPAVAILAVAAMACGKPPPGKISGRVVDFVTGAPVGKAKLEVVVIDTTHEAETKGDGTFFIDGLAASDALLQVSADGYGTSEITVESELVGGELADPSKAGRILDRVVQVRLLPLNATIHGKVFVGTEAWEGAVVSVRCDSAVLAETLTDSDGAYSFEGLEVCTSGDHLSFFEVIAEVDFDGDGSAELRQDRDVPATTSSLGSADLRINRPNHFATEIVGHVFAELGGPVAGATVMLRGSSGQGQGLSFTQTNSDGGFRFAGQFQANTGYTLTALPHDLDGDGWADTGSASQSWSVGGTTNNSTGGNVILELDKPDLTLASSNTACSGSSPTRLHSADEDLYFLWNASVDTELLEYVVSDPWGNEIPVEASWVGNYMLKLTPEEAFVPTVAATPYRVEFRSVVFRGGEIEHSPFDGSSSQICRFYLGEFPEYLDSPELAINLDTSLTGATGVVFDSSKWHYVVPGRAPETRDLSAVPLVWEQVPGATRYAIYMKNSDGGDAAWSSLKTVTPTPNSNSHVYTMVELGTAGTEILGRGHEVSLVVKPRDAEGNQAPFTGDDPVLTVKDTRAPRIVTGTGGTNHGIDEDGRQHLTLEIPFSEDMDSSSPPSASALEAFGTRFKALEVKGPVYWKPNSSNNPSKQAVFENVHVEYEIGAPVTLNSVTGTPSSGDPITDSDSDGSFRMYALGQLVGVFDSDAGTVLYGTVAQLNSESGAMSIEFEPGVTYTKGSNDVIFDPCQSRAKLTAPAHTGATELTVDAEGSFFTGQQIRIGRFSGPETREVFGKSTGRVDLTVGIAHSHEVGSILEDEQCYVHAASSNNLRGSSRVLDDAEQLRTPTSIGAGDQTLTFNNSVDLTGVVRGDRVLIDADGNLNTVNDQVQGTVASVETLNANGSPLQDGGAAVKILRLRNVTALHGTTLPLVVDPTDVHVEIFFDGFSLASGSLSDTSGNGPLESTGNVGLLNSAGTGVGRVIGAE